MSAEAPTLSSLEAEVREHAEDPIHKTARETAGVVRKALENQAGSVDFSLIVNGKPFFEVNPALGGRAGINVSLAYLEEDENGKACYHELLLRLKYTGDPLKGEVTWPDFVKALIEPERRVEIQCSFDAEPGERAPIILEDKEGRIVVNKTEITSLRYMDKE